MRIDGIQLQEGSTISNLTVASGLAFPNLPSVGELFYLTGNGTGLYFYTGTNWVVASGSGGSFTAGNGLRLLNGVLDIITASSARIAVGPSSIDLAAVTDNGTGSFVKISRDVYGRVTGTTAVTTGDVTPLLDATYVNVAGDTMTGALAVPGINITGSNRLRGSYGAGGSETNFALGDDALTANTTGLYNVAIGPGVLNLNTTGQFNTGVGVLALEKNTIGQSNSAFGALALNKNTTGIQNVGIGYYALTANTTGQYNVAVGGSLLANTTGSNNTALGSAAMGQNVSGSNNTAVGSGSLSYTTGSNNTAIGYVAGAVSVGIYNTFLGSGAGAGYSSGSNNTVVGSYTGNVSNLSDTLVLATGQTQRFRITSGGGVIFGASTTAYGTSGQVLSSNGDAVPTWASISSLPADTRYVLKIGDTMTGSLTLSGASALRGSYGPGAVNTNVAIGDGALAANTTGFQNTAIGKNALAANVTQAVNVAIGMNALKLATAIANVAIGAGAMEFTTTGETNVAVGRAALGNNTTGYSNTGVGHNALGGQTTGYGNVAMGYWSGVGITSGSYNTLIGHGEADEGGGASTLTSGSRNTFLGVLAGKGISTGSNNLVLGYSGALPSALSSTIVLGAGTAERIRITSDGNVGIGTSSPGAKLDIVTGSTNRFRMAESGSSLYFDSIDFGATGVWMPHVNRATQFQWLTKATGQPVSGMLLDTAGNLSLGILNGTTRLTSNVTDAGTNSVVNTFDISHYTTATPVAGFGVSMRMVLPDAGGTLIQTGLIQSNWVNPAAGVRTAAMTLWSSAANALVHGITIDHTGFVGMGTTTPAYRLDVISTTNSAARFRVSGASTNITSGTSTPIVLQNSNATTGNHNNFIYVDANNNVQGSIGLIYGAHSANGQGTFYIEPRIVSSPTSFVVKPSGYVGMGTFSPLSQLDVAGDITVRGNIVGPNTTFAYTIAADPATAPLAGAYVQIWGSGNTTLPNTLIFGTAGVERLRISNTGAFNVNGNGAMTYGPNTTWGAYLRVGGDGPNGWTRDTLRASVVTTNGNLHLDPGTLKSTYLNFYAGSNVIFGAGNGSTELGRIDAAGTLTLPKGIFTATVSAGYPESGFGSIDMRGATEAAHTGYVQFFSGNGVRQGYIGFSTSTGSQDTGAIPFVMGRATFSSIVAVQGAIHAGAYAGPGIGAGDIVARRASNQGVYYFGDDNSKYLFFDSSNYILSGGPLIVGANALYVGGTNNLIIQHDGTNAFVRPLNSGSTLFLGAENTNTLAVTATNVTSTAPFSAATITSNNFKGVAPNVFSTTAGTSYGAAVQMREVNGAGAQGVNSAYAPRLGFHWGGVVASSITIEPSGRIAIMNNPGDTYEHLACNAMYALSYTGTVAGSTYGAIRVDGLSNGFSGVYLSAASGTVIGMVDVNGNGGTWDSTTGWQHYWSRGNACLGLGGTTTASGYRAYTNGSHYVGGNIVASGTITGSSDARLKTNVEPITNALEKVKQLDGVTFEKIDEPGRRHAGLIAQNLETVHPETVYEDHNGMKTVAYGNTVGLLIEAIKELTAKVESLQAQLDAKE